MTLLWARRPTGASQNRGVRSPVTPGVTAVTVERVYDEIAVALAERRHGVTTTDELRRHGVTREQIRMLTESRGWERAAPTVLRRVGSAATPAQALAVDVLDAGPEAFLAFLPGANWWGLKGCALRPVHVVGTSTSARHLSGSIRYHRVRRLPTAWTTELDGIPIVRPELLSLQLFAVCRYQRAERLTESLWSRRLLSGPSLRRFLREMGRRGRNGSAGLRKYLDERPDGYVPTASGLESRVGEILVEAGIRIRPQVDTGSDDAWTGRVDFLVVGTTVVVEVQSERYHCALVDVRADSVRRQRLEAAGFTWVEVWDHEVWAMPWVVVDKVRDGIERART